MTHDDWEAFYRAWHEEWAMRRLRAAFAEARKRAKRDADDPDQERRMLAWIEWQERRNRHTEQGLHETLDAMFKPPEGTEPAVRGAHYDEDGDLRKDGVPEPFEDATWADIVEAGAQDSQLVDALLKDMGLQS